MPNISLHFKKSIAHLTFSQESEKNRTLTQETLNKLSERLDELSCHAIDGLIIHLHNHSSDLTTLTTGSEAEITQLIITAQTVFNRIADLEYPTTAAIQGTCIGSGYELTLACDWRIASNQPETKIGLPEISQGTIPASGGTTRLPELLGLPNALPILLSSHIYTSTAAKEKGLIDEICHPQKLTENALTLIEKGKRHHEHNPIVHNPTIANFTRKQFTKELQKHHPGHHPAAEIALEVAVTSIGSPRAKSQSSEIEAIHTLISLPEVKNLLRFSAIKHRLQPPSKPRAALGINHIAIIGASRTGWKIATELSISGIKTILYDPSLDTLAQAIQSATDTLTELTRENHLTQLQSAHALDLIHPTAEHLPTAALDLAIITSPLAFSEKIPPHTHCAIHTTGQPISSLAPPTHAPENIIGLHIQEFTPNTQIVEIIRTNATCQELLNKTTALISSLGKIPIIVKDTPGFIINRLLFPYLAAAADLFKNGGDPDEIDTTMLDFGMSIGPLHMIDQIGLKTVLHHTETLHRAYPKRITVPETISQLLSTGHHGRENNSGFFVYDTLDPAVNAEAIEFQTGTEDIPENTAEILSSIILEEAALCLKEGLISSQEQLHLLIILGIGYPTFRSTSL